MHSSSSTTARWRFRVLAVLGAFALPAAADGQLSAPSPVTAGYLYNFKADIDGGGGDLSSQFFTVRGGVPIVRDEALFLGLSASYRLNAYDFSPGADPAGFGALDPWENVHTVSLSVPVRWKFGERWSYFGLPSIRFVGESDADVGDALEGGIITGVWYEFGDRLTIGPGIGFFSQIEDDVSLFPVIFLNWNITESISLDTGPGLGATRGPGLALNWDMNEAWRFSFGARYEKLRFRLGDDADVSPGGVGQDRGIPVYAGFTFDGLENWRFTLLGGVQFGGELRLEDSSGDELFDTDYDPAPFIGVTASLKF